MDLFLLRNAALGPGEPAGFCLETLWWLLWNHVHEYLQHCCLFGASSCSEMTLTHLDGESGHLNVTGRSIDLLLRKDTELDAGEPAGFCSELRRTFIKMTI